MKKAATHNLGCKVNAYETEAMEQLLAEAGYEIVDFTEYADVYVVNTCSVTNMADRKSRQMLHRARKRNPDAVVVAAGCYAQIRTKEAQMDGGVDIILGNNRKHELIAVLDEFMQTHNKTKAVSCMAQERTYENLLRTAQGGHTRAFMKVQDGCNQFCSYCIIPYARGRVRSRRMEDVLREIEVLGKKGYREFVFTGIHLSSYGTDTGESLLELIKKAAGVTGVERIRLGSLEPSVITKEFVQALTDIPQLCPHFHLSLQSGCDATLKRMNRCYNTAEYEMRCRILQDFFEHPAVTTDVIVGFPGETEEEFAQTKEFLKRIHFYEMHIFKYSKREGTNAAKMDAQVEEQIKSSRSAQLIALEHEMSADFREYYVGRRIRALMEELVMIDGKTYAVGYTKEYVKVAFQTKKELSGLFLDGQIVGRLRDDLYLMVEF